MVKNTGLRRVVAAFVTSTVCHAFAQDIDLSVACSSQYDWMSNSDGQSPCVVASYLWSACNDNPTDAYIANMPCECSTVYYAIYSACKICQDDQANEPWRAWKAVCHTKFYPSMWPNDIPHETSIPAWAFLDAVYPHTFNVSDARAIAAQSRPDSPAPLPSSATRPLAPRSDDSDPNGTIAIIVSIVGTVILTIAGAGARAEERRRRPGPGGCCSNCGDEAEIAANNAASESTTPPHTPVEVQPPPSEGLPLHGNHDPNARVASNDAVRLSYNPQLAVPPSLSPRSPPPVAVPSFTSRAPRRVAVPVFSSYTPHFQNEEARSSSSDRLLPPEHHDASPDEDIPLGYPPRLSFPSDDDHSTTTELPTYELDDPLLLRSPPTARLYNPNDQPIPFRPVPSASHPLTWGHLRAYHPAS